MVVNPFLVRYRITSSFHHHQPPSPVTRSVLHLAIGGDNDDCDDGWEETIDIVSETIPAELRSLQEQRRQDQKGRTSNQGQKSERDLFIPIVSIVSLTGLVGAYGYEMIRLYLRGELYLPWNNQ